MPAVRPGVLALATVLLVPLAMVSALTVFIALTDSSQANAAGEPGVTCSTPSAGRGKVAGYSTEQMNNAAQIVTTGTQMGIPQQGWVIAVTTAITESSLTVINHGDTAGPDSRGLFQQRASWGPEAVRMDPRGSARLFYQALRTIPHWQALPIGDAAQAVQSSARPYAYAGHEQDAREIVGALAGITCRPASISGANPRAATVIAAARSQLGVRYAWGGGTAAGPSPGIGVDAGVTGFDCSGLALYAYAKAGVAVPHQTQAIWAHFAHPAITAPADVAPGDLVLLSSTGTPGGIHHVAIYLGDGTVIEAPHSGATVRITRDIWHNPHWSNQFIGAVRPGT